MACGKDLAKRLLILFNIVFVLGGLILFSIGIWIKCDDTVINNLSIINVKQAKPLLQYASVIFIIVGIATFVIAIIGLLGALREHQGLLFIFAALVMSVIIIESIAALLALTFRVKMGEKLQMSMTMQSHYLYGHDKVKTSAWDVLQSSIKCCGSKTYLEYYNGNWYNATKAAFPGKLNMVPSSCCVQNSTDLCQIEAYKQVKESAYLYVKGCYPYMMSWFHSHSAILIVVGFITAIVQLTTFSMACCLRSAIKQSGKI